jgi:hypothetical protein
VIEPGLSEVVTYTPAGTQPRWLGTLGHVEGLSYSWINPGGADAMACTLQAPADLRTDAMTPGRILKIFRGGGVVWDGKLLEPAFTPGTGWALTGTGVGTAGNDFRAYYTSAWGTVAQANQTIDNAIGRGLRWTRTASVPSGVWFGQVVDPAADTITGFLNLLCTKGTQTWYVTTTQYGNLLSVYTFPQQPTLSQVNRILVSPTPVARTLGGDINFLYGRYQTSADTATAATYATTTQQNSADITAHGQVEDYDDLSSSGQQSLGTIQAALQSVLNRYQRVSFAGPFTVHYGELLNAGGYPVDLGIDHCGTICKVVFTDYGYGGEVLPEPVIFMVGSYAWDEHTQIATIAPFQSIDLSMAGLLSELALVLPPRPKPPVKKHPKAGIYPGYPMIPYTPPPPKKKTTTVYPGYPMIPAHHKKGHHKK